MVRTTLTLIGYWSGPPPQDDWPSPMDLVDPDWDPDIRDEVADYLRRGFVVRAYAGYSLCRVCGRNNGSLELSDGAFVWPEGLPHYIAEHQVRLPESFVAHVLAEVAAYEHAGRDDSWWRSQRRL